MTDLIFDANSLFARCWFAVREDPDACLRAVVLSVLQLMDPEHSGRIGVPISRTLFAWDGKSKTQKNHKAKSQEYVDTRRELQEALLTLFGTDHAFHPDYEADDIVATAVFNSNARQIYVVSGDKDLMQLHESSVAYYCLNAKHVLSSLSICSRFGVKRPAQASIALAIMGDSGDGIPGIPKWGPKKVRKLFESVTEEMNYSQALEVIQSQIPAELQACFLESLDKTLLHNNVPGVPPPAPLAFCTYHELEKLDIMGIDKTYERVAARYGEDYAD
jgi:5'-3' exonuclease